MSDFETAVSAASEATRDRETEAAHGGDGRPECEAEAYADTLGRLHQAYAFDGMVALYITGPHGSGAPELHVMTDYFNDHFGASAGINHEPIPSLSCIRKSVMISGVKIFCIEEAKFVVVA